MALKSARPSEIGTIIKAELTMSRVIQATTNNSTMRSTNPYLLKDRIKNYKIVTQKKILKHPEEYNSEKEGRKNNVSFKNKL